MPFFWCYINVHDSRHTSPKRFFPLGLSGQLLVSDVPHIFCFITRLALAHFLFTTISLAIGSFAPQKNKLVLVTMALVAMAYFGDGFQQLGDVLVLVGGSEGSGGRGWVYSRPGLVV